MTDLPNEEPPAEPMEAYRWAALGATELVLLSGPPGIGKSALVLDMHQAAEWAADSMTAAVQAGILTGRDDGLLAPKDDVTRAEAAVILYNLLGFSELI